MRSSVPHRSAPVLWANRTCHLRHGVKACQRWQLADVRSMGAVQMLIATQAPCVQTMIPRVSDPSIRRRAACVLGHCRHSWIWHCLSAQQSDTLSPAAVYLTISGLRSQIGVLFTVLFHQAAGRGGGGAAAGGAVGRGRQNGPRPLVLLLQHAVTVVLGGIMDMDATHSVVGISWLGRQQSGCG
jgi:hypothetical protein